MRRSMTLVDEILLRVPGNERTMRLGILASLGGTLDAFFPELIREWQKQGVEVFGAAGDPSKQVKSDVITGLTRSPRLSNLLAPASLREWIDRHSLDVVLTNTATASALVRLHKPRVPIVYFCHGLHWKRNDEWSPVWRTVERYLLGHTTAAIVSNSEDEAWLNKYLGGGKVARLPFGVGVPIERFVRTPSPPLEGSTRLAWIGEFSARKRPEIGVEVARYLRDWGVDFRLTMAGEGAMMGRIREEISRHGLTDRVSLPGRTESGSLITRSHLLLHTSRWEGLARVLLEAAAIGRNSYGFEVKGVRDLASVATVQDGDARALATLIRDDIEKGLPAQPYPPPEDMTSAHHADIVLSNLRAWLAEPAS